MAKKKNNFYAVKKGKIPGLYKTWDECKRRLMALVALYTKGSQQGKRLRITWMAILNQKKIL